MQNFRAKPGTAMHAAPEPGDEEFLAAVATARVVLGPRMHRAGAAEPVRPRAASAAARRRHRRLGRRLADHARSRQPREAVAVDRGARGAPPPPEARPFASVSRSTRSSRRGPTPSSRARCARPVDALLGADGRAVEGRRPCTDRVAGPRRPLEAAHDRPHVRQGRPVRACARTPKPSTARPTCPTTTAAWAHAEVAPSASMRTSVGRSPKPSRIGRSPTRMRWRCSAPRATRSMRSAASPTACAPRRSGTTSPT